MRCKKNVAKHQNVVNDQIGNEHIVIDDNETSDDEMYDNPQITTKTTNDEVNDHGQFAGMQMNGERNQNEHYEGKDKNIVMTKGTTIGDEQDVDDV